MAVLLGIDVGTSSVRAMLLWPESGRTAVAAEGYDVDYPRPRWAEQDPRVWYAGARAAIGKVMAAAGARADEVAAVSFSGQMHGLVALDKDGALVRPAIIHLDQRSAPSIAKIYAALGEEAVAGWVQNSIAPSFLIATLYWLFENERAAYDRVRVVCLPKDYVKFRLTGRVSTDYSDAAGTAAFDNVNLRWAAPMIEALGMDAGLFPEIYGSFDAMGTVTAAAARETGLRAGTLVVSGGADQCMQAIGNGITAPGVFACNIGTSAQISTSADAPLYDAALRAHTMAHAIPGKWNIMAAILSAGASLKWFAGAVLGGADYAALDEGAARVPAGCGGLYFLPHLLGERFLKDADARGMFFGLTPTHDRFALARAVMEGVVFSLRDCLDIITDGAGIPCGKIVAAGGGARGSLWPQIQADILEQPLVRSLTTEEAALGAAIAAGVGAGVYPDAETATPALVRYDAQVYEPDPARAAVYRESRAVFRELYPRTRDLFKTIAGMGAAR